VRRSDGQSFTVTVNNVNQPPVLAQPNNQSVAQGTTSDQTSPRRMLTVRR